MTDGSVEGQVSDGEVSPSRALHDQLCFALYSASRAVTGLYRPMLEQFGLTYPQYLVMLRLWEGDALPVGTLAEELHVDYGTMSPLLKRLEEKGLVVRVRSPHDEREVKVCLTERGRQMDKCAEQIPARVIEEMALGPIDLLTLRDALTDLRQGIALREEEVT